MQKRCIADSAPGARRNPWLRRYHSTDALAELICFPHAGGAAGYWRPLSDAVQPFADLRAVQYPGRQDRYREPAVRDLHRLADLIAAQLTAGPPPAGPRVLLGHSMGASLAHEVALRLSRVPGQGPAGLVVSGRRAPSRLGAWKRPESDEALVARVRALGGTDPAVLADPGLLEVILPALRADYEAVAAYVPGDGVLACPVVALTGDEDAEAPVEDVAPWAERTRGSFALRVLPGGHFFLDAHVPAVAGAALALCGVAPAGGGAGGAAVTGGAERT
ncbi:alpha/beta fold hydrolase [Streptomyces sp. OfavH-34-F]|uniref:thioesterase II family protein n=1 Tax=unclassified Streptomyces TaxID=2593676 RepID=UPI001EF1BA6E|nr:alpha/beta fold hydrolase [Streptomyces sp. OfavH-34-F]MCG7529417.1 alpha/beta fold hydrolase [Streptomyces sp. OfavH-34-F]